MNGDRPTANGERIQNGVQQGASDSSSHVGPLKQSREGQAPSTSTADRSSSYANGVPQPSNGDLGYNAANGTNQAPLEILQLIPRDNYLPMAALISRASQSCWNGLTNLVEQLAAVQVPEQSPDQAKVLPNGLPNNQTKANLDKKERLLKFANDQKADFIKLLVLLQWSRDVEEVGKTISINYWLMKRRQAYWDTIALMAGLKQESAGFQMPNPDLRVAAEVLSRGEVLKFPSLGYLPQKDLTSKQILRLLKSLNRLLSVKLALSDDLPPQLRQFHIHDGRATFIVPDEFELDVSILDENPNSQFRVVDFRYSFSPSPYIPDSLHAEIERYANSNIDRGGLQGCYFFLKELALSSKLAEYHKQVLELARSQWAGNLRVELIRRNLVVQYWSERQASKSWMEVGIASGREKREGSAQVAFPVLEIKWMRQGKKVDSLRLRQNESVLCFEDILRQIIAQHSTQILDGVYDKLVLAPLFAEAELSVEQSLSDEDPEQCSLSIQLSRSSTLQLKVDAVTGLLVISPVSEKSERLQYEVNRIHGVADEIVSKLLNFRCSVVESSVLAGISGTSWEILRAFKFSPAEIKALFGGPVVRMNLFRQSQWGVSYSLAVTHGQDGDHWWLLQQMSTSGPNSQSRFQVLRHQRIEAKEELSSAYFDRLAEYAMGLICLRRNADFLKERKEKFNLPSFPPLEKNYELPPISFDLDMARPTKSLLHGAAAETFPGEAAQNPPSKPACLQKSIQVRFGGVDRTTNRVTAIAHFQNRASAAVLKHLDESTLDSDVTLNVEDRTVTIRVKTSITEAAIPRIVDKATDLEKIVSTVEQIHRLPGLKLRSLSNSAFTIIYHQGLSKELGVSIAFGSGSQTPRLEFFPSEDNPHGLLTAQYSKLLVASRVPFATKVRDFLTSLTLTLPLLSFLYKLQRKHGLEVSRSQTTPSQEPERGLRVHVLVRSATAFAVQYFTPARHVPGDVGPNSQPHLLARLEILPHINASKKPMWLVRAALEEFQSNSRPSYSTPELRTQLRQEIFTRTDGQKWLALDSAAACMADQPEALFQAMHDLLSNWATLAAESKGEKEAKGKAEPKPEATNNLPNGNTKPNVAGKLQAAKLQRPTNPNVSRVVPGKGNPNPPKIEEYIMLD
ncbi:uncharacterized protein Z518_04096 [Rhinocladiella mackenziei CBS 650.93]|uniref:Mediator of RNA polymerase II transcription subunit 14 n=1 Tax=Rhinocladiella mackenziei CBS 650.93 TaxID=1442369 RepID=A0A0D2FVF4_9EURO|nr:uncharacterized protein Z518_04096 [Rhinocladiella mackenziei CBS 650.93]KIX06122.1 hypothetical protein Z518_04096 [Rhinocladiella mackenziei CBS 650.93]